MQVVFITARYFFDLETIFFQRVRNEAYVYINIRPFELPSLLNEQTTLWDANLVTQRAGEERERV